MSNQQELNTGKDNGSAQNRCQATFWATDDLALSHKSYKSGVKRLNTLGHLDQYMAQHGRVVKQSYCETV